MATSKLTLSAIKAYSIPLILLSASLFFQLVLIPRSFPPSHYDVLGIKRYSSAEQVREAYNKLSANWNDGMQEASFNDFIKIQYAFELLMNPLWKRDYDIFGIDEQVHVIEKSTQQYSGARYSEVHLPLLEATSFDPNHAFDVISSDNFLSKLDNSKALLVQVFSLGSKRSAQFSSQWKRIDNFLDGVANTCMVEVGDLKLATYLAEKKSTGEPLFRTGLPSLVAFPPGCRTSDCIVRYTGDLSVDGVTDFIATDVLSLPRIPYYSKESMVENFLRKGSRHKVKVIFVSKTGQRASPSVRQVVKTYWDYASYAFALWKEEDSVFWSNMFGVEDAPAIIIVKDPGVKPVVYHGSMNNSRLVDTMEQNKHQVLPQLRSVTSMELGCDPKGYSRAGMETMVWYCVVVAGRLSPELQKMRETMRSVQEKLLNDGDLENVDDDQSGAVAAITLKRKRLTFAWLDGEAQQRYCFFYVSLEDSYDTCGTRKDITDVPRLYIVRYQRNDTEVSERTEKYSKNVFTSVASTGMDPTVQLVAVYKGLNEIPQIIEWISEIIRSGDNITVPYFKTTSPDLVPEDADPMWSRGKEKVLSSSRGVKLRFEGFINNLMGDPRIGPILLLGALMSFGGIYMMRNQSTLPNKPNPSVQPSKEDEGRADGKTKRRPRRRSSKEQPPSITDEEPKDAYQMPFSDSDSE